MNHGSALRFYNTKGTAIAHGMVSQRFIQPALLLSPFGSGENVHAQGEGTQVFEHAEYGDLAELRLKVCHAQDTRADEETRRQERQREGTHDVAELLHEPIGQLKVGVDLHLSSVEHGEGV